LARRQQYPRLAAQRGPRERRQRRQIGVDRREHRQPVEPQLQRRLDVGRHQPQRVAALAWGPADALQWGEAERAVDFFDVSVWREKGEAVANHKRKGDPILIEGRLQYRTWEAKDGSRRSKVDVVADSVQFLGKGNGSSVDGGTPG